MIDNKFLAKVYYGYKKEAVNAFIMNKVFYCVIFPYYYFTIYRGDLAGLVPFVLLCLAFELYTCFFMYDIFLKLLFDKRKNLIIKEKVKLVSIKREISNIGNRGYSRIGKFYEKKSHVDRYRIYYSLNGKKKYIRTVLEFDQMDKFYLFIEQNKTENSDDDLKVEIEYFKNSRVLINILSSQEGKLKKEIDELFGLIFRFEQNR